MIGRRDWVRRTSRRPRQPLYLLGFGLLAAAVVLWLLMGR